MFVIILPFLLAFLFTTNTFLLPRVMRLRMLQATLTMCQATPIMCQATLTQVSRISPLSQLMREKIKQIALF